MLLAVCREFGLDSDFVTRGGAFCFGGGFGNMGHVCGAVSGAMMAIGLARGRSEDMETMFRTSAMAQEFQRRFEAEMGNVNCRELTGLDLSTPNGVQQLMSSDIPQTVCFPAVGIAYRIVEDLLRKGVR